MYGNNGRILKVNLSTGEVKEEIYDEATARLFLGGNGLAAKLIYDNVPFNADPLGPDNAVVFSVGPLTDTPVWGTSRGHVASISPLTGFSLTLIMEENSAPHRRGQVLTPFTLPGLRQSPFIF
jgi:aldehyde:ferredoxin oxidoreductase